MKNKFNLNQFEKIEDIIFIDEPILSHLRMNDIDYLFYLVETTENSDIFLLLEVEAIEIFKYITARESLKNIISNNKKLIIVIEQNFNGEIVQNYFLNADQIDPDHLPEDDSFIELQPTKNSYYYDMIHKYEGKFYLETLRKDAFYLKFSSTNKKYGEILGLKEIANNFLEKISKSYTNFLRIDFNKRFKNHFTDRTKLNSTINRLIADLDFRMVDLKFGSFEIGLSVDDLMKSSIEDKKIRGWAKKVAYDYKKIVLDEEITKEESAEIIRNFSEEERFRIFKPIIEIADNPNFELKIKNDKDERYKYIGLKNKKVAQELLQKNLSISVAKEQDLGLIQFTAIIDKNDKKKFIKIEDTLFNQVHEAVYTIRKQDFEKYNFREVPTDIEIKLLLEQLGNKITLKTNYNGIDFTVFLHDNKIEEGIKKMTESIYEYILNNSE